MKPFPKLPNPHPDHAGRNFVERKSKEAFARIAKLWQPSGEENEITHSTVSRYAQYLIDRLTGKAYSADELLSRPVTAADITDASASGQTVLTGTPAQARTALEIESTGSGTIRLPKARAAILDLNYTGYQSGNYFTYLALGDSLGHRISYELRQTLERNFGIYGYALEELNYQTISGTVTDPGANVTGGSDFAAWDTGRIRTLADGAVMNVGIGIGTALPSITKIVRVWAAKQSGGGSLVCQYSTNGGSSWVSLGSDLATSGTANELASATYTIANQYNVLVRLTASGGPVKLIGCSMEKGGDSMGVLLARISVGGLEMTNAQALAAPAATRAAIAQALVTKLVGVHFSDGHITLAANLTAYLNAWSTATNNADILAFSPHDKNGADTSAANVRGWWSDEEAARNNVHVYDTNEFLGGNAQLTASGWNDPDAVHLDDAAWKSIADDVYSQVFSVAPSVTFSKYVQNGSDNMLHLGARPTATGGNWYYDFWRPQNGYSRIRFLAYNPQQEWWSLDSYPANHAALPHGFVFSGVNGYGGVIQPWTVDRYGRMAVTDTTATVANAHTAGARLYVRETTADKAALLAQHTNATPTAPVLQVKNSAGTSKFEAWDTGNVVMNPVASATPGANGNMVFELTSDTALTVKVKGSDGVVRTAVLTLSP